MATILVVDDNPVSQRLLAHTLRKHEHTVITVPSGADALAELNAAAIDLVITDLAMPEMDGIALLKAIHAEPRWATVPVLMLTASGEDHDRMIARQAGAAGFMTKPTSSNELVATVNRCLENK